MDEQSTAPENPGSSDWSDYRPGTKSADGASVTEVLQRSTKGIVFLNEHHELEWEYDESGCVNGVAATAEASALIAQLGFTGLTEEKLRRAHLLIAAGLSCAFDDNDVQCERHFTAAKDYIRTRQTERLQTAYLLAVLLTGLIVSGAVAATWSRIADPVRKEFAIGVSLGALGAVVSVAQRFRTIIIERYGSLFFTALAGVARVLFGALFGFTLIILQKSGIVLSGIDSNAYAIAAASLAAGFSERMIPDLVGSFEGLGTAGGRRGR